MGTLAVRKEYARQIREAYQKTIEGIFETGELLLAAKKSLAHGEFLDLVERDVPFSVTTADRLMKIASDRRLQSMPKGKLPAHWTVLHELSMLSDDEFKKLKPSITPEIERAEVRQRRDGRMARPRGRSLNSPITRLEFEFPETPTINKMLELAGKVVYRKGKKRHTAYSGGKKKYGEQCDILQMAGELPKPPKKPWSRWRIASISFRTYNPHDYIELMAGLKWPVDWLVTAGYVKDDSPRELLPPLPWPDIVIDRKNPGSTIVIERVE